MRRLWSVILTGVLLAAGLPAAAQTMNADQIVEKANLASYYAGKDGMSDVKMTITDSQGRQRIREFRILRLNIKPGGEQKYYVYFFKPADVAKMVYMVWKHPNKDDDRWLYLPALDLVRRIAASDKRSSFVGSHFVYEDVSGRTPDLDTHTLVATTPTQYEIKNVPKDAKDVEFKYYNVWIDKKTFLPVKAEYYNDQNKMVRSITALKVQDVQGFPTVVKAEAKDLERGGHTVMEFSDVKYNVGLTDSIFSERYLRRPPAQWIR